MVDKPLEWLLTFPTASAAVAVRVWLPAASALLCPPVATGGTVQRQPGGRQRHAHARGGRHQTGDRTVRRRLRRRLPGRHGTDRRTAPDLLSMQITHGRPPLQLGEMEPAERAEVIVRPDHVTPFEYSTSAAWSGTATAPPSPGRPRPGRRGTPTARHDPPRATWRANSSASNPCTSRSV